MAKDRDYRVTVKLTSLKTQLSSVSGQFLSELTSEELRDLLRQLHTLENDIQAELRKSVKR